MIIIKNWWSECENANSRKLKEIRYFSCPSGNDSKGYRKLMRMGNEGLVAFGVFQALSQCLATLSHDARKADTFQNSDGSLLDMDDLSDLTRISPDILESAIDILLKIQWISIASRQSADEIPSSPDSLPTVSHDPLKGEEGRVKESKGEERRGGNAQAQDAPAPPSENYENSLEQAKGVIDQLKKWRSPMWGQSEYQEMSNPLNTRAVCALTAEDIATIKAYVSAPKTKTDFLFSSRDKCIQHLSEILEKAHAWAEKNAPTRSSSGGRDHKVQTLASFNLKDLK